VPPGIIQHDFQRSRYQSGEAVYDEAPGVTVVADSSFSF
jgi:hypothetical protein